MKTLSDLRAAYADAGLLELFNALKQYARNSIVIEVDREFEPEELGMSHLVAILTCLLILSGLVILPVVYR